MGVIEVCWPLVLSALLCCCLVQDIAAQMTGDAKNDCRYDDINRGLFFRHCVVVVQVPISYGWAMLRGGIAPPQAVYSSAEIGFLLNLILEPPE